MSARPGLGRSDVLLLLILLLIAGGVAWSASTPRIPSLEERARQLESGIRCPVCQGLSIVDSPALLAEQMRAVVREQLVGGASDAAVQDYFTERYGRWILLTPSSAGPDLALWLAPAAIVALGAGLVAASARSRRRRALAPATGDGPTRGGWSRLGQGVVVVAIVGAVAAPLAVAFGPRDVGQQITGGVPRIQGAPSIAELEARVATDPGDVATLVALGDAYVVANRGDDAVAAYKRALTRDPNNAPALLQVGLILLSAGRPADAGPLFDRVLKTSPDQPDALFYRALARYQVDGRLMDEARSDLVRFVAVAPSDPRRTVAEQLLVGAQPSSSP